MMSVPRSRTVMTATTVAVITAPAREPARRGRRAAGRRWRLLTVVVGMVSSQFAVFGATPAQAAGIPPVAVDDAYTVAEGGTLTTVGGTWHLPGWRLRRSFTFNNTGRGQLDNFPVLVKIDPVNIDYTRTQSLGQDLRFVDSDGTPLAYEIEEWNTGRIIRVGEGSPDRRRVDHRLHLDVLRQRLCW